MLEYYNPFLEAAFTANGNKLTVPDNEPVDKGSCLRYLSGDYCYPTMLIVGQLMEYLDAHRSELANYAIIEPQTGGACRAGNLTSLLQHVLQLKSVSDDPDFAKVNVMSLEVQKGAASFPLSFGLLFSVITAVLYGELVMFLYQQTKPYESEKNAADSVRKTVEKQLIESILHHENSGRHRRRNIAQVLEQFTDIARTAEKKRKIGITGEIYMKFSYLGNDHIEEYLNNRGFEVCQGGFLNYCLYVVDAEIYNAQTYRGNFFYKMGCKMVLHWFRKLQRELHEMMQAAGYQTDECFLSLKKKAKNILDYGNNIGDGWLIAAETIQYIERGCDSVLILHPFGCLVSHMYERGIMKKLHQRYPQIAISTIEFDYDQSKALRESRIQLAIAKDRHGRVMEPKN